MNGGPNWIRFGHHSGSEDGIETEAVFPGANRSLKKVYNCKFTKKLLYSLNITLFQQKRIVKIRRKYDYNFKLNVFLRYSVACVVTHYLKIKNV